MSNEITEDNEPKEEKARRAEYLSFLDEKSVILRKSLGEGIGPGTRKRLLAEGRFHAIFLVVLLVYVLVVYYTYNVQSIMLFESVKQTLIIKSLPEDVWHVKKTFYEIGTSEELNLFLIHILYPGCYSSHADSSRVRGLDAFQIILGGVRIRQLRVNNNSCTNTVAPGGLTNVQTFSFPCYLGYADATEDRDPFGDQNQYTWTSAQENGATVFNGVEAITTSEINYKQYGGSGYVVDIGTSATEALQALKDLNTGGYYDKYTRGVFVEFAMYSPSTNLHTNVQLFFERPTSVYNSLAAPKPKITPDGGREVPESIFALIADVGILIWVVVFVVREMMDMFLVENMYTEVYNAEEEEKKEALLTRAGKEYTPAEACDYHIRPLAYCLKFFVFWELIHLVNVMMLIIQYYWKYMWLSSDVVLDYDLSANAAKFQNLYPLALHYSEMRHMMALTCFLSILKLLKYMQLSLRLNILVLTIVRAQPFLIGFSLIFMGVFTGFALMGLIIYGSTMPEFSSIINSVRSLFAFLTGHFYYDRMMQVDAIATPIFVYSYMLLVAFVLLNMFIAILNESFSDVSTTLEKLGRQARARQKMSLTLLFLGECGQTWCENRKTRKQAAKLESHKNSAMQQLAETDAELFRTITEAELTEGSPLESKLAEDATDAAEREWMSPGAAADLGPSGSKK